MPKLAVVALLSVCTSVIANQPAEEVVFGRGYGGDPVPAFDKGYLIFTHAHRQIEVWSPSGTLAFSTTIQSHPGASIMNAAVDTDGTAAVGIAYTSSQGHAGGIVILDASGKELKFVDTQRYMPAHLCFDKTHRLWAFGWQRGSALDDREDEEDYPMFRTYSRDGTALGAYVIRSLFPKPGLIPGYTSGGLWRIHAADNRIGAIAYSGQTSNVQEWIELSLDGNLLGHWPLGQDSHAGLAFTSDARLWRMIQGEQPRLQRFDRTTGAWKSHPANITGDNGELLGILLGAEGQELAFAGNYGLIHLRKLRVSSE